MKHIIQKLIAWYLRRICGGACHCFPYGPDGRYIVLMTEGQYHGYTHLAEHRAVRDEHMKLVRAEQADRG